MKWINGYLMFDGNCAEAMKFYERCFGGDLSLVPLWGQCAVAGAVLGARFGMLTDAFDIHWMFNVELPKGGGETSS